MKKEAKKPAKLTLCRESIHRLEGDLRQVRGASGGEDCSIGSVCITCHCTTVP